MMINKKAASSISAILVCMTAALFLLYEPEISPVICDALAVFVERVLPPLFPFMVLSKMIVSGKCMDFISRKTGIARIFHLPDSAGAAILCGLMCGFPIGAAISADLYDQGMLNRHEAGRLTALASNTSPAFIIGTVGAVWSSRKYGLFLFVVQSLSAIVIAHFLRGRGCSSDKTPSVRHDESYDVTGRKAGFCTMLCRAVSDSAAGCIAVCAYIVFFRAVSAMLCCIIPQLSLLITAVFEFSSGCIAGAAHGGILGCFITGFSTGFSGLSVMMQIYNYTGKRDIPFTSYIITKLSQGLLCGAFSVLFYFIFRPTPSETASLAVFAANVSISDFVSCMATLAAVWCAARLCMIILPDSHAVK